MNRKQFFKGLLGVGAMSIVPSFIKPNELPLSEQPINHENLIKDGWTPTGRVLGNQLPNQQTPSPYICYSKGNVCLSCREDYGCPMLDGPSGGIWMVSRRNGERIPSKMSFLIDDYNKLNTCHNLL